MAQDEFDISKGLVISNNDLYGEKLNLLKELYNQAPEDENLPIVPTEGWFFGLGEHHVKASEVNNLSEKIQDWMIKTNTKVHQIYQEFTALYEFISALDNDFIKKYQVAINLAFKAIEEIRVVNEKSIDQQNKIEVTQQDIKKLVNQQKKIIDVLKTFKDKLEELEHLYDIDAIYNEVHDLQSKIDKLERASVEYKKKIKTCEQTSQNLNSRVNSEIEQLADNTRKENKMFQNEMTVLHDRTIAISKSVLLLKGISFSSIIISLTLLIVILTGLLR